MKEKLKIAFLDTIGLVYNGDTLKEKGLGGSESAIIYLGEELTKIGMDVTVFNKCDKPGVYNGVKYINFMDAQKNTEEFHILITSRTVLPYAPEWLSESIYKDFEYDIMLFKPLVDRSLYKILWLHDTFILGENLVENLLADNFFDEIFTLSDFHTQYIPNASHGNKKRYFEAFKRKIFQTRNGVKSHYNETDISAKDPDLFVYNASVSKGMVPLLEEIWPKVHEEFPDAKLTIIGGYYRMADCEPDDMEQLFYDLKKKYEKGYNIEFTGIIPQKEIAGIYQKASFFIYPGAFPETFGISATEALNYNVPLITNRFGALEETAPEDTSYLCEFPITRDLERFDRLHSTADPNQLVLFLEQVRKAYTDVYLRQQKMYAANKYKPFLGWDTVALQWKHHILRKLGLYMNIEEEKRFRYITSNIHKLYKRRFVNSDEYFEDFSYYNKNDIVVISPVYNAEKYIASHILSIASQLYDKYTHYIIDDMSTDNTYKVAEDTIKSLPESIQDKFVLIKNTEKRYALGNQVKLLNEIKGNPIVMLLDGDDKLVNDPDIFNFYNREYELGAKFTYGSCHSMADDIDLVAQSYPKEVHNNKSYRSHQFNWGMPYTHLRTFRKELFDNVEDSIFRDSNNEYYKAGGDNALFYPLIEQCEENEIRAIGRITVMYNDINPLNDYKVNPEEQTKNKNRIVGKNMKDNKDTKRILIGVPTAKNIETDTFKSIYDLIKPDGVEVHLEFFYGYSIDQVRNLMAHFTIENKFDYILFVDSDMVLPEDALVKLYESKKDIVSGLYRQRNLDQKIAEVHMNGEHVIDENFFKDKKYVKVDSVGFGGILIKREVLEKIGYPQFVYHDTIDFSKTISEDTDFCIKAKNAGYEIIVMPEVKYGHITSTILNW